MLKIAEYSQLISDFERRAEATFSDAGLTIDLKHDEKNTIHLVFVGQYSAGKSSIIKMLTGIKDIVIGPGITTEFVHKYSWQGIEVIDTPGIHTELRPDHDDLSYNAISQADLLVYVITNELFDSLMAENFRVLAIDQDKAGEMILVVNKMLRTREGNCASQQQYIKEGLRKVVAPYSPEELHISFLDALSYFESLKNRGVDDELADLYLDRSGYQEFVETLNQFIQLKHITGKLTTILYQIDEQLERTIKMMQSQSDDPDIDGLEEGCLQQRHELIETRGRLQQEIRDIYSLAASKLRELGSNSAALLAEGCNRDDVEAALHKAIHQADDIIDDCQAEAISIADRRFNEMGSRLEAIENSEFSKVLKASLDGKFEGLPEGIQRALLKAGPGFKKAGQAIINRAYKDGTQGGLKLTNFSGSKIHDAIQKVAHSLGYKFKPWQAVKLTKGIAIGGHVLNVFGIALTVFLQIKTDQDKEKISRDLRKNQQNIRSQFNAAANGLEDYGRSLIKTTISPLIDSDIESLDHTIQEIRASRKNRSITCRRMENLQNECHSLIKQIHSADSKPTD